MAGPYNREEALLDVDDTPAEKHCPRVMFVIHTNKWTKDAYRRMPRFSVTAAHTGKKPARSKKQENCEPGDRAMPALKCLSPIQGHPSLSYPVILTRCSS